MTAALTAIGAFFVKAAPTIWTIVGLVTTYIIVPELKEFLREKKEITKNNRLHNVAIEAVAYAEETAAQKEVNFDSEYKYNLAKRFLTAAFPELNDDTAYDLLHAALKLAGMGASAKTNPAVDSNTTTE